MGRMLQYSPLSPMNNYDISNVAKAKNQILQDCLFCTGSLFGKAFLAYSYQLR